jgi:hypothetical protein
MTKPVVSYDALLHRLRANVTALVLVRGGVVVVVVTVVVVADVVAVDENVGVGVAIVQAYPASKAFVVAFSSPLNAVEASAVSTVAFTSPPPPPRPAIKKLQMSRYFCLYQSQGNLNVLV